MVHEVKELSVIFRNVPEGKNGSMVRMGALTCIVVLCGPNLPPVLGYKRARREQCKPIPTKKPMGNTEVSVICSEGGSPHCVSREERWN